MHYTDEGRSVVFREIGNEVRQQIEGTGKTCSEVHRAMAPYLAEIFDISTSSVLSMMANIVNNGHIYQTTSSRGLEYNGERHRSILSVYLAGLNYQGIDVEPVVKMVRSVDDEFVYPPTEDQVEKARYH